MNDSIIAVLTAPGDVAIVPPAPVAATLSEQNHRVKPDASGHGGFDANVYFCFAIVFVVSTSTTF
jgi:hypothetical protein